MSVTTSPMRRLGVERDLDAWRNDGDFDAANALLMELRPTLAELGKSLGMLYTEDHATRAIKAALALSNRRKAPPRWRRRSNSVASGELAHGSIDVFAAVAVHELFDLGAVPELDGPELALSAPDRAVLRLQLADVVDEEPLAAFLRVNLDELDQRCAEVAEAATSGTRKLTPAAAFGSVLTFGQGIGAAVASPAAAAGLAGFALVVGVTAGGLAVVRAVGEPAATTPAADEPMPTPGPGEETLEGPLGPGVEIPGLNVPTVDVDTIELEDVLPEGADPDRLVPSEPLPSDLVPSDVDPTDLLPTELPSDLVPSGPLPSDLPVAPEPGDLLSDAPLVEDLPPDESEDTVRLPTDRPDLEVVEVPPTLGQ